MKNYGTKSEILLGQKPITQMMMIMRKNMLMILRFYSDDDLPLKKSLELRNMIIVVRAVFHEDNKYYPQVFLEECLYEL